MNFTLNDEQQLLEDSVVRFVRDHYALEERQKLVARTPGFSKEHWQMMAELGWLALPFDEADGGLNGGVVETMVLMEQFGAGLVLEPYLATIVMGGGALRRAGSKEQKEALLPGVIAGGTHLALAYAEEQARFDLHDVATRARADGDGFVLNGQKSMVLHGGSADTFIVSARTNGAPTEQKGISLFILDAGADGLTVKDFATVDGLRAAELTLADVRVGDDALLGVADEGFDTLRAVADEAILALSAEAVGAIQVLQQDTVAYTQERNQFGHPLSDFQALQHRMVDMFVAYEQCKSMLLRATMEYAEGSDTAGRTSHALKHLVGKSGIGVAEEAVQMHGGMGMTEELRIGHYFKRLLVIDSQFGNADYHLMQFAA